MYVLTRRRSWDEVEQTLCLGGDRAASRDDESAKGVSAGVVVETIFFRVPRHPEFRHGAIRREVSRTGQDGFNQPTSPDNAIRAGESVRVNVTDVVLESMHHGIHMCVGHFFMHDMFHDMHDKHGIFSW